MHQIPRGRSEYAVSEVVGAILLIMVAAMVFVFIYNFIFPLDLPDAETQVQLMGYIDEDGYAIIEHMGGQSLDKYVVYADGELVLSSPAGDRWEIGECCIPPLGKTYLCENDSVHVSVYSVKSENYQEQVFDAILYGRNPPVQQPEIPMLVSSLQENSVDEDLICYRYYMNPEISAETYVYNWYVNGNPICDIVLPFDTNDESTAADYSGSSHDGTVIGPSWISDGVIGGGYSFDGDDVITFPYCYEGDYISDISVEVWIKTSTESEVISSFTRDKYWELRVFDGLIRWSTHTAEGTVDTTGTRYVSDNMWHHIVACYESATGTSSIYVDGMLDTQESSHTPGVVLGTGDTPTGSIGQGSTASRETILSTSFENQDEENVWSRDDDRGNDYLERGDFERYDTSDVSPRTGSYTIGGSGDMVYRYRWSRHYAGFNRETIDISDYSDVTVAVWYSYKNTENSDEIGFYYNDGGNWISIFSDTSPETPYGEQCAWMYAEQQIPEDISNLDLQFWFSTSESSEYLIIDDLEITGIPLGIGSNYSGTMDEYRIYNRVLSAEQIYQNYMNMQNDNDEHRVIVSDETLLSDIWHCQVTPNDRFQDGESKNSNLLEIVTYPGGD